MVDLLVRCLGCNAPVFIQERYVPREWPDVMHPLQKCRWCGAHHTMRALIEKAAAVNEPARDEWYRWPPNVWSPPKDLNHGLPSQE